MKQTDPVKCICKKKTCERHGNCVACVAYHRQNKKRPLPYCKTRKKDV
ncbi:MAG: hypothetical protein KIC77_07005 [Clostridiales bacterium]|nr:hypothetical protein [Clostridiales bacterium]